MLSNDIRHQIDTYGDEVLLTEAQASAVTNFATGTLRNQRHHKRSIFPYVKLPNGAVRYPVGGLRAALKRLAEAAE